MVIDEINQAPLVLGAGEQLVPEYHFAVEAVKAALQARHSITYGKVYVQGGIPPELPLPSGDLITAYELDERTAMGIAGLIIRRHNELPAEKLTFQERDLVGPYAQTKGSDATILRDRISRDIMKAGGVALIHGDPEVLSETAGYFEALLHPEES